MTTYYFDYIEKNEKLLSDIYQRLSEKGLLEIYQNNESKYGAHFTHEEKIKINDEYNIDIRVDNLTILATVNLKDTTSLICWDKWSAIFGKEEPVTDFNFFKEPYFIQVKKSVEQIQNLQTPEEDIVKVMFYQFKHDDTYIQLTVDAEGYSNEYVFAFDFYNEIAEDSSKNPVRNKTVEYNYEFLRQLKDFPNVNDYIEEITDYIFIGKELSQETRDIMYLCSDINKEMIDNFELLKIDINDFSKELKNAYEFQPQKKSFYDKMLRKK